jgi:hypothetical protein
MCAATVGAVAAVAGTAASVGSAAYGMSQAPSGAAQVPRGKNLGGFGPATALQSYTARELALNKGTKTPSILDWAASGGNLRPDWKIPDFTPREATQLRLVEQGTGKKMPTFDPATEGSLSDAALAEFGREQVRNKGAAADSPEANYSRTLAREDMLRARLAQGGLAPGRVDTLNARLANTVARRDVLQKKTGA